MKFSNLSKTLGCNWWKSSDQSKMYFEDKAPYSDFRGPSSPTNMTEPSIGISQIKTLFHEEIVHYIVWNTVSWTFFQVFLFGVYVTVLTHFSMFANILKMSQNCNTAFYEWSADQNKILSKLSTAVSSVGSGKSDSGYQHCNARQTAPGTRSENFWEMVLYCYLVGNWVYFLIRFCYTMPTMANPIVWYQKYGSQCICLFL